MSESKTAATPQSAETSAKKLLAANAAANLALSERCDPKLRAAAAKAAKVDPNSIIGVAKTADGFSIVLATETGVEKVAVAAKGE